MSHVFQDNAVRQQSRDEYRKLTEAARLLFINEIEKLPNFPPIALTTHEFEVGKLPNPKAYEELIARVETLVTVRHQYRLSPAQKINALFDAAIRWGLLTIDGKQPLPKI